MCVNIIPALESVKISVREIVHVDYTVQRATYKSTKDIR